MAGEKALQFVRDTASIGVPAVGYAVGSGVLTERTKWSEAGKGAAQGLVGVALGVGLANKAPRIATGFAVGGMVALGLGVAREFRYRAFMRSLTAPAATNANASAQGGNQLGAGSSGGQLGAGSSGVGAGATQGQTAAAAGIFFGRR